MQYTVTGIRHSGSATLELDAPDSASARRLAQEQGLSVIAVRAHKAALLGLWGQNRFPLMQFNQGLLTLLAAGLALVEAIEALAEKEARNDIRQVMRQLLGALYEGQSFSVALEAQPTVFPPLYIATVRANERTGALPEAIERFIHYRTQIDLVRKRIISASIYPLLILGVGALVILFLLLYVVPRFSQVFDDLGDRIPAMSQVLLHWGQFVHQHTGLVLGIAAALPIIAILIARRPQVRALFGRTLMRIPRIGAYVKVYQLARFYRTLGMLLRAGIPILAALDMVGALLPASLQDALGQARADVNAGRALSTAFDDNGLSTPVALRMLRVGERTGRMGEMMDRIAGFHDDDVAQAIDWFIRLFEPLLMVVIGGVIGAIVLLMYAPIFELAGAIQ